MYIVVLASHSDEAILHQPTRIHVERGSEALPEPNVGSNAHGVEFNMLAYADLGSGSIDAIVPEWFDTPGEDTGAHKECFTVTVSSFFHW